MGRPAADEDQAACGHVLPATMADQHAKKAFELPVCLSIC
jgi:hypothetical protein